MTRLIVFVIAFCIVCPNASADLVLDFDDLDPNVLVESQIPQGYGDTLNINVSYRERLGFGDAPTQYSTLILNVADYGDLNFVAYGNLPPEENGTQPPALETNVAEIRFDSLNSDLLTLQSFDIASSSVWFTGNNRVVNVYDGDYNALFESGPLLIDDQFHDTIVPNVSAPTLIVQWDYPNFVGVDNINIRSVPEPSSLLLLAVPSVGCVLCRKRIRQRWTRSRR